MSYYVAVDIGCLECEVSSSVIGIFTKAEDAKQALAKARKEYEKEAWSGDHSFVVFPVAELNVVNL